MDTVISAGYQCPTCGLSNMPYPPRDYNICPCCGTEFGLDDDMYSHRTLRNRWLERGAKWFSDIPPYTSAPNWDPYEQLELAGLDFDVRRPAASVQTTYGRSGEIPFVQAFWSHDSSAVKAA